jgi:hypothetical protein
MTPPRGATGSPRGREVVNKEGTASGVAVRTTKEGPVDLVALVKDVAEPLFRSTISVPVITLPLLFFGGFFMGWFISH